MPRGGARILVIGGGLAGLATAYHLAKSGRCRVTVIEREKRIGVHASGNNAGMIRQTVGDPVAARLAREGRNRLSRLDGAAWGNLAFRSQGSILLAKDKNRRELDRIVSTGRAHKTACRFLHKANARRIVPPLAAADYDRALFCPTDATVDVAALLSGLEKTLRRLRVRLILGHSIDFIQKNGRRFVVRSGSKNWTADKVVNAAGAWAHTIGRRAGASLVPLKPYFRHLYESRKSCFSSAPWPFVWDLSHGIYFRPIEAGRLLLSPCDKSAVKTDVRRMLVRKLKKFSPALSRLPLGKQRVGLRTMAPDSRFVVGEDPKLRNFFWVAGLGGHGVTTSLSVGDLAARLVLGKKTDPFLTAALSPARFR